MAKSKEAIINGLGRIAVYLDKSAAISVNKQMLKDWASVARDAAKMLEGQKASVLTEQDVNKLEGYVWSEVKDDNILGVMLISYRTVYEQCKEPYSIKELDWEMYGRTWRLWSAMPTKADRNGVKWDG